MLLSYTTSIFERQVILCAMNWVRKSSWLSTAQQLGENLNQQEKYSHLQVKKQNIRRGSSHNSFWQRTVEKWCLGGSCRPAAAQTASPSGWQAFELEPALAQIHFNSQKYTCFISYFNNNGTLRTPASTAGNTHTHTYIYFKSKGMYTHPYANINCVGFNFCLRLDCARRIVG